MHLLVGILAFATVGVVVGSAAPAGAPVISIRIRVAGHFGFPTGAVGKPYSAQLTASGGTKPFHWKVAAGKLPAGLKLNALTGKVTGKPTKRGRYAFIVQVADAHAPPRSAKLSVSITIK